MIDVFYDKPNSNKIKYKNLSFETHIKLPMSFSLAIKQVINIKLEGPTKVFDTIKKDLSKDDVGRSESKRRSTSALQN